MIHLGYLPVKEVPARLGWQSLSLQRDYEQRFGSYKSEHVLVNKHPLLCKNDNSKMHDVHLFAPDPYAWEMAINSFICEREILWQSCKPLTLVEAISRCNKSTVSGYIPKELYKKDTKGDYYMDLAFVESQIQLIESGVDVAVIWKVNDKEEIRVNEKVDHPDLSKRKQRTMMSSDALHYVVGMMLFAEQNDKLIDECHSFENWSAAGVSIFHGEWDRMARYLTPKGDRTRVRCKDVSAMESCVQVPFQQAIYFARKQYLTLNDGTPKFTDRNYIALFDWWVHHTMYSTVVDMDGCVWLQIGQNPSGCLNTLYDNIDTNILLYKYHLAKHAITNPRYCDIGAFIDFCYSKRVRFMGDDSIYVDEPIFDDLDESANELGIVMTDESNGAVPLSEATFCGFGFMHHNTNTWLPKVNVQKQIDSLLMNKKNNSLRLQFAKLCAFKILFWPVGGTHYDWICDKISEMKKGDLFLQMHAENHLDNIIPMSSLLTQELSAFQIRILYSKLEALEGTLQSVPAWSRLH